MTLGTLARRAVAYYRRTNAAVVLGMACAVAVLSGALLVGTSVRASLHELSVGRLGRTDLLVTAEGFFREALAEDVARETAGAVPLIVAEAFVTDERSEHRGSGVQIYGVDARFWRFHAAEPPDGDGERGGLDAWVSPGLARELELEVDDPLLIRTRRPSEIPQEFLHGRRDEVGRTMRMRAAGVLARDQLGAFSLHPDPREVRAVFVPLDRLQRDVDQQGRVNAMLIACGTTASRDDCRRPVRERATLDDLGIRIRSVAEETVLAVESRKGLLDETMARAAVDAASDEGYRAAPLLTYVANAIRHGDREVPYSLVTAMEAVEHDRSGPTIVVNDWAAERLGVSGGERVTLEYYVWEAAGRLETRTAELDVAGIAPVAAADRDFSPQYPGISDARGLADWEPPFPVDLGKIGPDDEAYWDEYRTTPKAFVPLEVGQRLWGSRYGEMTSVRVSVGTAQSTEEVHESFARAMRARLDPLASGLIVLPVREEAERASVGATDFGEYFVYFSFFLVVAALLLAALFFRLGIEQRVQQIGLLRAVGFQPRTIRRLFLLEAIGLALLGGVLGMLGAVAYAWLIMLGLRTWWVGAVGTTLLELHPSLWTLLAGAVSALLVGMGVIWWTLRALQRAAPRALLGGDVGSALGARPSGDRRRVRGAAWGLAAAAVAVATLTAMGIVGATAGFFSTGTLLLLAALAAFADQLTDKRKRGQPPFYEERKKGAAPFSVARLGMRYAAWRRGRSVLSAALIAAAVFLIVSVETFRREGAADPTDPRGGTGGYSLVAESLLPLFHDPSTPEGRDELNLMPYASRDPRTDFTMTRFRLRPGDDASCANLYRPQRPRVIGASADFIDEGRFSFGATTASTQEERQNPWLLLRRDEPDGAVPVIADATSLQYVLHRRVGDELVIDEGERPLRLRVVAALTDSVLQGELIVEESRFLEMFPDEAGYRFFLIDRSSSPEERLEDTSMAVAGFLEARLDDFGLDAVSAADRLAGYRRVENTYLSTFQALGALGLLLGTLGLAAVAVRNVLERRRELALLRAIGYRARDLSVMIVAENAMLLGVGLGAGVLAALVAVTPVVLERGGRLPVFSLAALLLAVLAAGLLSSVVAARVSARAPLLSALRSE